VLDNKAIQTAVAAELIDARGFDTDQMAANRTAALQYYFGHPRGDETEGRSEIQSLDVADHVNSTMAQLSPMMKSSIVKFLPTDEADEETAQMESDVVKQIAADSNGFVQFSDAAFDSLLQRNGWVHCFIDDQVETWVDQHTDVVDQELTDLLTPLADNDVLEVTSKTDNPDGTTSLDIKHTLTERKLCIEAVAPEYMLYAPGHGSIDVSDIRFLARRQLLTKSELIEQGISKTVVDDLPTISYENWVQAQAREVGGADIKVGGEEPSTYVVETYDCYIRMDVDGDGIAELWRVRVAGYDGATFLDKELSRFIPYCTGTARPLPHRTAGTSLYDALRFIQDGKTVTTRQLIDNQETGNNVRVGAVEGEVNMDDLTTSRPGGVVRMRSEGAIIPIAFNDVGPSCINTLNYLDSVATARAGAAMDMMQGEMQIASSSATGAANEYGHKEKMSAFFARNIIETIVRGSYLLIHQALRSYYSKPLNVKINGKWQTSDPRKWKPRKSLRVIAGLSGSERREKAAALGQNIQYQSMALQAGMDGTLVTPDGVHNSLADWLNVVDLDDVSTYYVDPKSDEAKAAAKQKQEQQQQQAQEAEKLQQRIFDAEQGLDKYKHDTQLEFDRWKELLDAQVEEMKVMGNALANMEHTALQAQLQPPAAAADSEGAD
jgi:hypothetical protein